MSTTRLGLIRHGAMSLSAEDRFSGGTEVDLSEEGRWETMSRAAVERLFPEEYAAWQEDPFTFVPQGGESGVMVMARALPISGEIVLKHAGLTVTVVSHYVDQPPYTENRLSEWFTGLK
jgi:broad specificity phosphatase PhoE